jgi:hypothetical protein
LLKISNKILLYILTFFSSCRKTQAELDKCLKEKMNIDRLEVGVLSRVRLYESERPKPIQKVANEQLPLPELSTTLERNPEVKESLKKAQRVL